ncbi:hypothetical protein L7P61_18105 [Aeromonas veronii bv. sobria]|uniref:Uncharacterized protein n=1 Tax=Aeromonas veronii TaxID=654 RepID=A0ABY3MIE8_AERVE|nr:hypothetical protein [Aeromonas veronii]RDU81320.1 hypothetical protein CGZ72_17205 [Aeromonas veronii]RDU81347.1 hypothetical protein CGZ76_18060 [Aeromonas veronii]TEY47602.1 hypothetical protein CIG14_17765 [Aeromonas veronii]TEY74645.1 hypothetical protein CIG16_17800 [Aeromonas veronii]TYD41645.1 hypothetical protein CJF23_16385 [Aeromonas veronii]
MKISLEGALLLLIMTEYSVLIVTGAILFIRLAVSAFHFMQFGVFYFDWNNDIVYSFKVGVASGVPAGIGICIIPWVNKIW